MNNPEKLSGFRVVGTNPIRPDGLDKVTGRAVYGDDFKIAGMLHGKVLRSPHAHARIKSIDTRKALRLPGVRAIITGADFPKPSVAMVPMGEGGYVDMNDTADNVIAKDKAYYDGHVIAAVAADNPHVAEEAVALIDVKYEVLPPVMDVRSAMAPGAPVLHENFNPGAFFMKTQKVLPNASRLELGAGDIARGFKEADVIVEREFTTETVHQGYIESHICTAQWDEGGQVTIWTTTQGAFAIRDQVAIVCAVPMSHVRVVPLVTGLIGRIFGAGGGRERIVESAIRAGQRNEPRSTGAEALGLKVGDDVRHQKFGEGVIIDIVGAGDKAEARVRFREAGEKQLLLSWAPLEKL